MFFKEKIPVDNDIELTEKQAKIQRALSDAAEEGDVATVRRALEKGANPLRKYCSAFGLACEAGHLEVVKILHEFSCEFDNRTVHWTAYKGHIEVVDFLLAIKPDEKQYFIDDALSYTMEGYKMEMMQHLLALGADVNACKGAALGNAVLYNRPDMLLILLEKGAVISKEIMDRAYEEAKTTTHCENRPQEVLELLEKWPQMQKMKAAKAKRNALHRRAKANSVTPKM